MYSGRQSYTGHVKILGQVSVQWTPVIHWTGQVIVQRTPAGQEDVTYVANVKARICLIFLLIITHLTKVIVSGSLNAR